jgi:hypothetical protein
MSQENVEVVRGYLADDRAHREVWDQRGDYYPVQKFPESRPCHGIEEIERFHREFREAWEHVNLGIEAITTVADDRVLVSAVLAAEGRESGLNLHSKLYYCFWLRQGRVFRQEDHLTLPGALRALGLSGVTLEAAGLSE